MKTLTEEQKAEAFERFLDWIYEKNSGFIMDAAKRHQQNTKALGEQQADAILRAEVVEHWEENARP